MTPRKTSTTSQRLSNFFKNIEGLHWFHWMIVSLSAAVTLLAFQITRNQAEEKREIQFDHEATQVAELIVERMHRYEDALWGGVGALRISGHHLTPTQWRNFAQTLHLELKYPGINGIGIIYRLPRDGIDAFLEQQRQHRPEFSIHPQHKLDTLYPITFIEPVGLNQQALGLDVAFEFNRRTALEASRDTGTAQISGPITLVQDAQKTPGFLFYAPFYAEGSARSTQERQALFRGVVYAPFIVKRLMEGVLAQERRLVGIQIRDGSQLLFDELSGSHPNHDAYPQFTRQTVLEMYGRQWTLDIHTTTAFTQRMVSNQPRTILIGGLTLDALLFGLFLLLSRGNQRLANEVKMKTEAQEALQRARDRLEERVIERTAELERSNRDLESFAYAASHDLRTPLRGIHNLSCWLEEDLGPSIGEEGRHQLQLLRSRVDRMDGLLNALQAYNRVGRVQSKLVPTDIRQLVTSLLDDMDATGRFSYHLDIDVPIFQTPAGELSLVLQNLVQNAINHHDRETGQVVIKARKEEAFIHIDVADDGPGIPREYQEKVFQVFQTLKPRDFNEGSGIGLALVKKQVEMAGGQVTFRSAGRGTTFSFSWPVQWQRDIR